MLWKNKKNRSSKDEETLKIPILTYKQAKIIEKRLRVKLNPVEATTAYAISILLERKVKLSGPNLMAATGYTKGQVMMALKVLYKIGYVDSDISFCSPEVAQRLLNWMAENNLHTEQSGEIFRIYVNCN